VLQHKPPQWLADQQVHQSWGHAVIMWPDVDEQGACEEGVSEADRAAQTAVA
jgi:hypothetical protein